MPCGRGFRLKRKCGYRSPKFSLRGGGFSANVAVPIPVPPSFRTLNCRYIPMAGGYSPINIVARKN